MSPNPQRISRISLLLLALAGGLSTLPACVPLVAGGVGAGVLMATDRRSSGTYIEDEGIELKAVNRVSEKFGDRVHLNVTSFNRKALLTGEAPSQEIKDEVERLALAVPNIQGVSNELRVAAPSSFSDRSNDTWITSKVKGRFVDANRFAPNHVKVTTEAGTVYLLGIVTQREANAAVEVARTTAGVRKVVSIFEVVSEAKAKELDIASDNNKQPAPAGPRT